MKDKIINETELWQFAQGNLTESRSRAITSLLEEDDKLQKQYRRIMDLMNGYKLKKEKDLSRERIDRMYDSFLAGKKNIQPVSGKYPDRFPSWLAGFSGAAVLALFAIVLLFLIRPKKDLIMVSSYQYKQVVINEQEKDLYKLKVLPEKKVITSTGKMQINIQHQALVDIAAHTKFSIYQDKKYILELYKGKVNIETQGKKEIFCKVNQFEINPVGTAFKIQNDEKQIVVFLIKGKLEIINKANNKKNFLTAGRNNLFVYNYSKSDKAAAVPVPEDKLLYYKLAGQYKKTKDWQNAIFWYEQFVTSDTAETEEKYNALFELGFLYYDKAKDKEKAFSYWNTLLYSPYADTYSSKLKDISR